MPAVDREVVIEMYDNGASRYEIAEALGCCYRSVSNHLAAEGRGITYPKHDPELREMVRKMYRDERLGTYTIAGRLGYSNRTVQLWLIEDGLLVQSNSARSSFGRADAERALRLHERGDTQASIAAALGCSLSTVGTLIARARAERARG